MSEPDFELLDDFVFEPTPWDLAFSIGIGVDPETDRAALDELADAMLMWAPEPTLERLTGPALDALWDDELAALDPRRARAPLRRRRVGEGRGSRSRRVRSSSASGRGLARGDPQPGLATRERRSPGVLLPRLPQRVVVGRRAGGAPGSRAQGRDRRAAQRGGSGRGAAGGDGRGDVTLAGRACSEPSNGGRPSGRASAASASSGATPCRRWPASCGRSRRSRCRHAPRTTTSGRRSARCCSPADVRVVALDLN